MRLTRPDLGTTLIAGTAASVAYLAAQAADQRLVPNHYDDLRLWGGLVARTPGRQRLAGLVAHFTLGLSLAAAYQVARPFLPRLPGPLRGLLFAQVENSLLYPGVPVLDALHEARGERALPSLRTWRYFWLEAWRHVAYGLVLGALTPEEEGQG